MSHQVGLQSTFQNPSLPNHACWDTSILGNLHLVVIDQSLPAILDESWPQGELAKFQERMEDSARETSS